MVISISEENVRTVIQSTMKTYTNKDTVEKFPNIPQINFEKGEKHTKKFFWNCRKIRLQTINSTELQVFYPNFSTLGDR